MNIRNSASNRAFTISVEREWEGGGRYHFSGTTIIVEWTPSTLYVSTPAMGRAWAEPNAREAVKVLEEGISAFIIHVLGK